MKYRIEISSVAEAEADSAFISLFQLTSPVRASQWHGGLIESIESLSIMPSRCALARENKYFSQEIRQLLYDKDAQPIGFSSLFWRLMVYRQFAFCIFGTRRSKQLVKHQKNKIAKLLYLM